MQTDNISDETTKQTKTLLLVYLFAMQQYFNHKP